MDAILLDTIREKQSTNGNARYTLLLVDATGMPYQCTTTPDSGYAGLVPGLVGKWVRVQMSFKRRRWQLDSIRPAPNGGTILIEPKN